MKGTPYINTHRATGWRFILHPSTRWFCVYGIPNGDRDGTVTYSAAVRFGWTKRQATRRAMRAAQIGADRRGER